MKLLHAGASKINPISVTYSQNRSENAFGVLGAAKIPYRLGIEKEHELEYSDEVGVNTGSRQWQKDLAIRSGLAITRQINTSFNFARNKVWGLDGNQVRTETQTRDFLPKGIMGNKGLPMAGWSIRFTGVEKWPLMKKIARSASIEHGFNGKEIQRKRFDLIISNMLLNEQKNLLKFFPFRLIPSGRLIISGILESQGNEIINSLLKFNLILKKKNFVK